MTDIETTLKRLRTEATAANSKRTRAEVEHEQAEEALLESSNTLKTKFKCEDITQARALEVKLDALLEKQLEKIAQALEEV